MIKLKKTMSLPADLSTPVPAKPADVDDRIYKNSDVKQQLRNDQNQKCAYCERFFNGDYGAIEHYRPKRKYKVSKNTPMYDGYYWLAYRWINLLFSCSECNTSYKGTLFPLCDESKRDIVNHNISRENPLIINPYEGDPALMLGWHREYVLPISKDPYLLKKAETTIGIFELNTRPDLVRRRYNTYKAYLRAKAQYYFLIKIKAPANILSISQKQMKDFVSDDAEFVGMLRNQI